MYSQQVYDVTLLSPPQDKDIYLLDDPLAAVDTDVAEHLMKKCIMELLRGKTRILCTHRVEFVDKADMVVLMDNGTIIQTGRNGNTAPAQSRVVFVIRLKNVVYVERAVKVETCKHPVSISRFFNKVPVIG